MGTGKEHDAKLFHAGFGGSGVNGFDGSRGLVADIGFAIVKGFE